MPRLYVWCLVGGALSSTSYLVHKYVYVPSLTTKRDMELFVEAEKSLLLQVYQRLHALKDVVPALDAERVAAFCEIQSLREDAFALPTRLQSAIDKHAMMRELDRLQQEKCPPLMCRTEPLTCNEQWKCFAALVIFLVAFRIVFPVLAALQGMSSLRLRREASNVSRCILDLLEVDVRMSVDPALSDKVRLAASPPASSEGDASAQRAEVAALLRRSEMLWRPSCWLEEVAFWGSAENPWLAQQGSAGDHVAVVGGGAMLFAADRRTPVERFEHRFLKDGERLALEAAGSMEKRNHEAGASASVLPVSSATTSYFGYPCSVRDVALRPPFPQTGGSDGAALGNEQHAPSVLIPVVSSGVEKLVYVGASLAKSDAKRSSSSSDRYKEVLRTQYGIGSSKAPTTGSQSGGGDALDPVDVQRVANDALGLPLFSQESMYAIYGGRSRGSGQRRTVHLRVGVPSSNHDAWNAWVRTHHDLADQRVAALQ